jgi:transcriptional regulator with XRE-family HTH domain
MENQIRVKKIYNRLGAIMAHTDRYAFNPASKLAKDTGLSYTTIHCLLRGIHGPSYYTAIKITQALEKVIKRKLDPREIIHIRERFPTPIVCNLAKCEGCEFTHNDEKAITSVGHYCN